MAHAEYRAAVRPSRQPRAARSDGRVRLAAPPQRPLAKVPSDRSQTHASPPAQWRSEAPELDPIRHRISAGLAAWSERRAAALATGADRVLIAAGAIAEDDFLQAYSQKTGISFIAVDAIDRSACPLGQSQMLDAAAAGILPVTMAGRLVFVVAPRGLAARRLARAAATDPATAQRFAVTSTQRFQRFILRHADTALAERAAASLRRASPMLSAARRARADRGWRLPALAACAVALAIGLPGPALSAADFGLSALFMAWVMSRLLGPFIARPAGASRQPVGDANLPVYTVIAAVYREAASVADLVSAICRLDWPAEKMDAKLVVEADDAETLAAIASLDLDPRFEVIIAPTQGPRTKPKALNAALPFARGTFTVIYDAEDRPEPGQLREALDAFLSQPPELACVQAALTIDNTADSWLARLFTAEYAAQFDVFLPSLAKLRLPLPLGGSSNHFRTDALRAVGAWDPYNVTEDADLGMRLARFGYRSTVIASTTYEEAPARVRPWLRQRTRWYKGWLQTWLVHMRAPMLALQDLGLGGFATFQLVIGGNVLAALIYPMFLAQAGWRLAMGEPAFDLGVGGLHAATLIGGLVASGVTGIVGLARRDLLASGWVVLLAPLHWLLLSFAAWRGLIQLLRAPYRWDKTEHGLAKSSRRSRALGAARSWRCSGDRQH